MTYTQQCEQEYINWFNNYLSIDKFAEDMNYTKSYALEILRVGKEYHFDKALNPSKYGFTFDEWVNFKINRKVIK